MLHTGKSAVNVNDGKYIVSKNITGGAQSRLNCQQFSIWADVFSDRYVSLLSRSLSASPLERPRQVSAVLTWIEDRLLPMLRKRGAMKVSVTLLHTTRRDGRSMRKLRVTGITSLQEQRSKVTSGQTLRLSNAAVSGPWRWILCKKMTIFKMWGPYSELRTLLLYCLMNWCLAAHPSPLAYGLSWLVPYQLFWRRWYPLKQRRSVFAGFPAFLTQPQGRLHVAETPRELFNLQLQNVWGYGAKAVFSTSSGTKHASKLSIQHLLHGINCYFMKC